MKERPILFSGPMVRAILEGRKTMTRRVVKPQPPKNHCRPHYPWGTRDLAMFPVVTFTADDPATHVVRCPYGIPGDRLWVKEGVWCYENLSVGRNRQFRWPTFSSCEDWARRWFDGACEYTATWGPGHPAPVDGGPLNKMFMPRWASRITLEVTSVRVERVQEISEEEALAEGVNSSCPAHAKADFSCLWDSINAKRGFGWEANPWVWVIEFRRIESEGT